MAGWFKFLFCYFLFPSFPRGGVLPLPLPPPRALDPSDPGSSRLLFSIFLSSCCPSFFIVFSIPFLMPLGSIFPANLLPQIHQNPSKIDAKMPSHVDFVFLLFFDGFLLPTSTPGTSRIKPPLQREHDLSKIRFSQFVLIFHRFWCHQASIFIPKSTKIASKIDLGRY